MSKRPDPKDDFDDTEQVELNRLLLTGLASIDPNPGQQETLRAAIMQRVSNSIADRANLLTVRLKNGEWQTLKAGVRFKHLWTGPEGNSVLIEFAPGASLPPHRHNWVEEGIVLQGDLEMGDLKLGPLDYHISPIGSRHATIRSRQGGLAFLRGTSLGKKPLVLRELLGGLLPIDGDPSLTVYTNTNQNWVELTAGVFKQDLWFDNDRSSHIYRLEPGAMIPAHAHQQDEECMMLQGEVFLGDMLLRAGEYQLAPAGSQHGVVSTDVGGTLFVRAARDY
jgi:quercetin dioxygenase-like cupin family protein